MAPGDEALRLRPGVPLALIDVDEVLALFVQGFSGYLSRRGHELRMTSFALFPNMFRLGAVAPLSEADATALFNEYFATGSADLEPAPGAAEGLARIAACAQVVILSNAPAASRPLRVDWLRRHGMEYPLILNSGPKGPAVAALAAQARAPTLFVDDLLSNLNSVEAHAPTVHRFQMVADPQLRPIAPTAPDRHPRVDDWSDLADAACAVLHGPGG